MFSSEFKTRPVRPKVSVIQSRYLGLAGFAAALS